MIVTPFAQILASLRSIRNNFLSLTNVNTSKYVKLLHAEYCSTKKIHKEKIIFFFFCIFNNSNQSKNIRSKRAAATPLQKPIVPGDEQYVRMAMETMEELDWCLDQLETIQTHRSVSDMASLKVNESHPTTKKFTMATSTYQQWRIGS